MNEQLKQAITLMQQGKEEGFNAVYSATYNHVYFRAKQTMKHEQDAEDLVQTVYTEAYRSISSLQSPDALFGWLDTITYNQGMKMFRKKKDVLLSEESEGMFEELETNDIASMPEPTMDEKETGNIIKELISELPEAQKASVTAYYFDGFSVGKIAEMMECTEGTVKSRLNYARKYLKDRILQKEKKEGYRLHVFSLPVLWYALWKLSQQTKMTAYAAETVYQKSCSKLGLTTTSLQPAPALAEAGAGTAQVMPSWISALADAGLAGGGAAASAGAAGLSSGATVSDVTGSGAVLTSATNTGGGGSAASAGTAGVLSVKAIIAAIAAVAVVSVGAAVVVPRLVKPQSDDTQQARIGSSQDEDNDTNAGAGDSADSVGTGASDISGVIDMAQYENDSEYRLSVNDELYAETLNTYQEGLQEALQLRENALDTYPEISDGIKWHDALENGTGIFSGFSEQYPYISLELMTLTASWRWNWDYNWKYCYCYYDLDGNGMDELIVAEYIRLEQNTGLGTDDPIYEPSDMYSVCSVFGSVDGAVENLLNISTEPFVSQPTILFGDNGQFVRYHYQTVNDSIYEKTATYYYDVYQFDGGERLEQIHSESRTAKLSNIDDTLLEWTNRTVLLDTGKLSMDEFDLLIDNGGASRLPKELESSNNTRWISIYPTDERTANADSKDGNIQHGSENDKEEDYEKALEQYRAILQESSFDMEAWEAKYPLAKGYIEYCFYLRNPVFLESPPLYTLFDIDGNGTDEMLVLQKYSDRYELSDIISVVNGKATNVICGGYSYKIYLQEDGLVVYKSGSAMYDSFNVFGMQENGEMKTIYHCEHSLNPSAPGETVYTDDKSLSEQRKKELTLIAWDDSPVPAALNPETSGVWKNLQ